MTASRRGVCGRSAVEHRRERIGGMGVIDDDRPAGLALGDELQAARNPGQPARAAIARFRRNTGRDRQPERRKRVHRLEAAEQRQDRLVPPPENISMNPARGPRHRGDEPQFAASRRHRR